MPSRASIDRFLQSERVAVVGVSRNPKDFANAVYRQFRDRGYEVFPVNPNTDEVEGVRCYRTIAELPDVDGALIMVPAAGAAEVVEQCAARGIERVWLHRGAGQGSVTDEAVDAAHAAGIDVVDGACPLMFLPDTGWFHRLHRRLAGRRIAA
ncbi:MAG TPA: CoA-binding protein [Ilumatobacter sp.]|nr:CoA-binding protein [Ilumatobacter sp.]